MSSGKYDSVNKNQNNQKMLIWQFLIKLGRKTFEINISKSYFICCWILYAIQGVDFLYRRGIDRDKWNIYLKGMFMLLIDE